MFTSQPGKTLWATVAVIYTLCKLPFLATFYLIPRLRPCPQWTLRQALMNNLMRSFLYHTAVVEAVTPLRLEPGSEGERFVQIPVADGKLYQGVLDDTHVKPERTGGTWYPEKPPKMGSSEVVLHLHGGGYAIGEGRPGDAAYAGQILIKYVAPHALLLSYRLASNKQGRFPAALQDAVTAYAFLLSQGYQPSQIIISGDSAGGHVAVSFLRYIASNFNELPNPKALLLWSPAVDLLSGRNPDSITKSKNYDTDYLEGNFVIWGAKKFSEGLDVSDPQIKPYLQPLGNSFTSTVPIWISVGELEIFCDEVSRFAQGMQAVPKNKVEFYQVPKAPHDVMFVANVMGWEPQAEAAAQAAKTFLETIGG